LEIIVMKIFWRLFLFVLVWTFFAQNLAFAQVGKRGSYGSDPIEILNKINYDANDVGVGYKIQDTALDGVNAGPGKYRIHNTLDWIRMHISLYLQWTVNIGLTVAVILLIYNGFLLVTGALHEAGKFEKVKWNIFNIAIGVLLLTWFYLVFKLIMALVNALFGGAWGLF